jgi:hypothetical protein
MSAIEHEPNPYGSYYGHVNEIAGLHEWKKVIIAAFDKFRRYSNEFRRRASRGSWRKEVNISFDEHYDWAFAEAMRLKGIMKRRDAIEVRVEMSDDENTFTLRFTRHDSKHSIWVTVTNRK